MNGLRYIREKMGLSGAALARKLTVSQPTVFEWEHGRRRIPAKQLEQLAQMFDIPKEYFNEISESKQKEIDILIEIAKQKGVTKFEDKELEQASKNLKAALQKLNKATKQKANSFETFEKYISSIQSTASVCNLFAEVLEVYNNKPLLSKILNAIIKSQKIAGDNRLELTQSLRKEITAVLDDAEQAAADSEWHDEHKAEFDELF